MAGKQDFQTLVLSCNKDGMDALRKGQLKPAFEQFKYAESILIANQMEGDNTSLLAVTCNNLGCYFKKVGKLHGALSYLRRALQMEVELGTDEVTLAGTHLNICAILSKLEKHDKAVQHALGALDLINKRVNSAEPDRVSQDDYSVLAIAYHNVAVERDFLHEYEKAAAAFEQGFQVAKRCLGEEHPLAITLGKNCDAVQQKSRKLTKAPPGALSGSRRPPMMKEGAYPGGEFAFSKDGARTDLPMLPSIMPATPRGPELTSLPVQPSVRQGAADWIAGEESAWKNFAQSTLTSSGEQQYPSSPGRGGLPPQAGVSLRDSRVRDLTVPAIRDVTSSDWTGGALVSAKKTRLDKAVDENQEALMDLVDADRTGHQIGGARTAVSDCRPNRVIKGSTRTAKVVRRTGMYNSMRHRDLVMSNRQQTASSVQKSLYVQKVAAERIQRVWRSWYKYCQVNSDWMTTTWVCATIIQATWRSYHVRRCRLDKAARVIQRHVRGHLVRKMLRKHSAAVTIQRRAVGILTRNQLRRMHRSAIKMQALIRGGLARKHVRERRRFLTKTAITIQCAERSAIARRVTQEKREAYRARKAMLDAVVRMQRMFRGHLGRKRADAAKAKYMRDLQEYQAATKLQAMARRDKAIQRVDVIRAEKLEKMNKAATHLRKMYLGAKTRKRYGELMREFARHEASIVTIQRYSRGFLVRLRMWREAVRAEEELWATVEIQRIWRGYLGRVAWEGKYEQVWRREMAAACMQRCTRGWLARVRVSRMRRKVARAEFERARRRFRSAQRVQALARGVLTRKVTRQRRARKLGAVVHIQRIARGHALRQRLWGQVIQLRATMIQAVARGYIVRNRRFYLMTKVICIQRSWRRWHRKPQALRDEALMEMRRRRHNAELIQQRFRQHRESRVIADING